MPALFFCVREISRISEWIIPIGVTSQSNRRCNKFFKALQEIYNYTTNIQQIRYSIHSGLKYLYGYSAESIKGHNSSKSSSLFIVLLYM